MQSQTKGLTAIVVSVGLVNVRAAKEQRTVLGWLKVLAHPAASQTTRLMK
jgi:hypothetical protein